MGTQRLGTDTTSVDALAWNGHGFGDVTADELWAELPAILKEVALAELRAGNKPVNILRNDTRGIVLLAFSMPRRTPAPRTDQIRIHTSYADGNYCYDGTGCTYEDLESGDFLAFDNSEVANDL